MSDTISQQRSMIKSQKNGFKKKLITILLAVVLVFLVLGGWWYTKYLSDQSNLKSAQAQAEKTQAIQQKAAASAFVYNEASKQTASGSYTAGQAVLDKAIQSEVDISSEAYLYIQKSLVAYNVGKYDDAYNFAEKSESVNPTVSSANIMAMAAEKKGDKNEAIAKYKLAISRMVGDSEMINSDRLDLQNNIRRLGGQI